MTVKTEIVSAIAGRAEQTQVASGAVFDATFQEIAARLAVGEKVAIAGFGVFGVREVKPRVGRNPRTGETVNIPAGRKLTFKPAPALKAAI